MVLKHVSGVAARTVSGRLFALGRASPSSGVFGRVNGTPASRAAEAPLTGTCALPGKRP